MTARVAAIWRHPIKSHGRERLARATLAAGEVLPWDRRWAVLHDATTPPTPGSWAPCQSYMIGTRTPALAALWATLDEETAEVTLRHPALGALTFRPDAPADAARFLDWIAPLCPSNRARPAALIALPGRGHTDTDFPSVSLMNAASHRAVAQRLGRPLEEERWRGNIWLDGLAPWEEEEWAGRRIRIGDAVLEGVEPIVRCLHTAASPATGERDADTLGALDTLREERTFGLYARVIEGGEIATGAEARPA